MRKVVICLALVAGVGCGIYEPDPVEILKITHDGNLNCVVFVQSGDTVALDFITDAALDSLKQLER